MTTKTPEGRSIAPRLTIGRDAMNGLTGLSDGDCFATADGRKWLLKPYNGGWCLRAMKPDGSPDYQQPPHPDFLGVDHGAFVWKVNMAAA